ncbi:hypothetical protein Tco_0482069 [Tanacetum coccineum]
MVTKLRNEITKFEQKPHESLFEAWERYKLSIDRFLNHNMLLVTQIDTFYNGLTLSHRDTINAAAGVTFMQKTPEECYELIENMTAHHNHWDTSATRDETSRNISSTTTTECPKVVRQLEMMNKNFVEMMRQIQTIKSIDTKCETCGGPHSFTECPAADGYTQEAIYATTELTLRVDDEAITFKVGQTLRYSCSYETVNQVNVIDVACEEYAQEVLGFSDSSSSGHPPPFDPIIASSLTPQFHNRILLKERISFGRN